MKNEDLNLSYTLNLPARAASFDSFVEFVRQTGEQLNLEASLILKLGLVAEELLINVIRYAYAEAEVPGNIEMRCGMADPERFCMVIQDNGIPFNPLLSKDPDLMADIDDRPIGGLGIFLVREIADHLDYCREKETNTVVFCKKVTSEIGK